MRLRERLRKRRLKMLSKKDKKKIEDLEYSYQQKKQQADIVVGINKNQEELIKKIEKRCEFLEHLVSHLTSKPVEIRDPEGKLIRKGWQGCDGIITLDHGRC